jgi:hypothetical protein
VREAVVNSNGFVAAGVAPEVEVVDAFVGTRDIFLLEVLLKLFFFFFFLARVVLVTTVFWNATAGDGDIILLSRTRASVWIIYALLLLRKRERKK